MEFNECQLNGFEVVSAKQAPFAQIQNHVSSNTKNNFLYQNEQPSNGKYSDATIRKGNHYPLQSLPTTQGKKSDISKRGVMPSPITQ